MVSPAVVVVLMVTVFVVAAMAARVPLGLALALAATVGGLVGGLASELPRHLLEGSLGYLDTMLIIASAMIFVQATTLSGGLPALASALVVRFGRRPLLLLPLLAVVVMLPGMITGSSTAAVLTTGALVAPVLIRLGLDRDRAGAFVAMAAIYGMLAPPVNIPAMLIGGGVDLPYVGLEPPLLLATVPLALVTAWYLGLPALGRSHQGSAGLSPEPPAAAAGESGPLGRHLVPWLTVALLMTAERWWPHSFLNLGLPLIFFIGAVVAWVLDGRRFAWHRCAREAVGQAIPVLAILAGVGMFIQVFTATGGRGWLVVELLSMPALAQYGAMAVGLPLFGAVSAFGAASVLGVPFLLAFLGRNDLVTTAGLSIVAGVGDLVPPTALAGIFAAQVVNEPSYWKVLRRALVPALLTLLTGVALVVWAEPIGRFLF
ncbi:MULTISPECIES: TRAP transporter large permease subunit [Limnochorda]|uniref:TRAP transporter large permease subunit n=1 Tax=Limnochorda TaxID=1676651 RepID=UPI0026F241C5|nr:TRAP transporter large permease subunit [Limnochorda pilosa]